MDIYVLNTDLEIIDVVDAYTSVIWTTRYYSPGDFELYLPATDKMIGLLREDCYLVREQDIDGDICKNVMIIDEIHATTDIEDGNYLTVTGQCLKSILSRRIVWNQTNIQGNVELGIRKILNENVISPSIAERKIDNFVLGPVKGFTDTMDIQVTGDEIASFLKDVCTSYGLGWDIYIDGTNFVFELYKGTDRSYNQTDNPYVVFSPEYDNLLTSSYAYSKKNYKNVALVAGEGEGLDRRTGTVGSSSGLKRYETFIDARDVSSNDGEIGERQYLLTLLERGSEKLSELGKTENFEGEIQVHSNYVLNEDYFMGDIVQVINEYGIEATPRIIEIIDSEDDTGRSIIPTFSTWEV